MSTIACIVEGHGEIRALPLLLRRLAERLGVHDLQVPQPIRVARDRFLNRDEEFTRQVVLGSSKAGAGGLLLIVLDADDDCPVALAQDVLAKTQPLLRGGRCCVALANREYESWLIAGAPSLASKRGLPADLERPRNSESLRNAKGWLSERMMASSGKAYSPVLDQEPLSAVVDLDMALEGSRSLRKLEKCVVSYLTS